MSISNKKLSNGVTKETSSYVPQSETSEDKKPAQTEDKQQIQEENNKPSSAEASAGKPSFAKASEDRPVEKTNGVSNKTAAKPTDEIAQPTAPEAKAEEPADATMPAGRQEALAGNPETEQPEKTPTSAPAFTEAMADKKTPAVEPAPTPETVEEPIIEKPKVKTTEQPEPVNLAPKLEKAEEAAQPDSVKAKAPLTAEQTPAQTIPSIGEKEKVEPPASVSRPVQTPPPPKTTKPLAPSKAKKSKPEPPVVNKVELSFAVKYLNKLKEQLGLANLKRRQKVQKNLDKIMQYARKTQKITNNDVERITGVKDSQAENYLNKLIKQGKLVRFGKTKNTFYKPISN